MTNVIETLGWDTLEHRRAVARVLLLYNIVNGLVAVDPGEKLCKQTRKSRHVKFHAFKKIQCKRLNLIGYHYIPEQWNSPLPEDIFPRSSPSQTLKPKFQNM